LGQGSGPGHRNRIGPHTRIPQIPDFRAERTAATGSHICLNFRERRAIGRHGSYGDISRHRIPGLSAFPIVWDQLVVLVVFPVGELPTLKIERISNGTLTETGKTNGESEKKLSEVVEKVVAGDGIEPTATSLGSGVLLENPRQ
jgi:hypothetical protein